LTNQEPTIHELNEAVDALLGRSGGSGTAHASVISKRREMNETYAVVQVLARDQIYMLRDKYRQVCHRQL